MGISCWCHSKRLDSRASLLRIDESLSSASLDSAVVAERDFKAEKYASASRINSLECVVVDQAATVLLFQLLLPAPKDSKLLGQIHVTLLKSIIKDIEDVARTPVVALGANQNSAANPGGGHPQIVEGAYGWGFDIRSWQRHLNFLTWPEILRQFAMSAGFGPQMKKRAFERPYLRDDNESVDWL